MSPYYIKRHVSNDSIYCYRYYFTDESAGYDRAFNYYVGFSDTDNSVKSVSYREIDYARIILNADMSGANLNFSSNDMQIVSSSDEDETDTDAVSENAEEGSDTEETDE